MMPHEAVGYHLINATAISAIVGSTSSASVWHGLRPRTGALPCINYFELPGVRANGFESVTYSINCRSATADGARTLARAVLDAFIGTSGTGMYGTENSFDVARASLRNDNGLIPEVDDEVFNAPVDITVVFATSTVS